MKKVLLSLVVLAVCSATTFAQISAGAKAGLNLSTFSGDDVEDVDMRTSFHFGGYLNYAVSETFSIQPELLYNSVGAKTTYIDPDFQEEVTETYKLSYLSVPVMLIYSFGNFNIQAGPQLGFLLSAEDQYEMSGQSVDVDIKDGLKGMDFGLNVGLGANFGKFNASARYGLGLSTIDDETDGDVKNNNIQISIGYRLFGGE